MPDHARRCSALDATLPCGREPLVAVYDISKRYGRTTAVAGVTLTLWSGEVRGFIGANGAGKTTILRTLAGILKPDGGGGQVIGFDLQRDAAAIRERVGYMSQRLSLYPELSVFDGGRGVSADAGADGTIGGSRSRDDGGGRRREGRADGGVPTELSVGLFRPDADHPAR